MTGVLAWFAIVLVGLMAWCALVMFNENGSRRV